MQCNIERGSMLHMCENICVRGAVPTRIQLHLTSHHIQLLYIFFLPSNTINNTCVWVYVFVYDVNAEVCVLEVPYAPRCVCFEVTGDLCFCLCV